MICKWGQVIYIKSSLCICMDKRDARTQMGREREAQSLRERDKEREREREREREKERGRERERKREREREYLHVGLNAALAPTNSKAIAAYT
jgi:hypothetical protein